MSNDKTLATVKHGGCVQLGDGPTIEKQARELLAKEWEKLSFDAPVEELREGCELPPVVAAGVRAIVAALSAHPSPDGQRDNSDLLAGLRDVEEHLYCAGSNPSHTATVRAAINALSAQPSPGGQGEVCIPLPTPGKGEWSDGWNACREAMLRGEGEALAARQPVGEVVEYQSYHGYGGGQWSTCDKKLYENGKAFEAKYGAGQMSLYRTLVVGDAAPPAQAVDLGPVRALLQRRIGQWRSHLPADTGAPGTREIETKGEHDYNNDVRIYREGIAVMEEVLSKVDSQAVGK